MNESKRQVRTSSIARKLNGYYQMRELGNILASDFFILLFVNALWVYLTESARVAEWTVWIRRSLTLGGGGTLLERLQGALYTFSMPGFPSESFTVEAGQFVSIVTVAMMIVFACQMLGWAIRWASGTKEVRRYLKPIDDIAQAAETASEQQFDESKFRDLADAIDHINASTPEAKLRIGDTELTGLEAAVNNLMKRMHESYRQQVRFVDDASHELRTPIAVIQGYANMLDRWGKDDEVVLEESIAAIKTEADHMKTLVEQLLFLARGDMGRQKFTPASVSLEDMLREIHEESEMIDPKHTYELKLTLPCTVLADVAMLKQSVRILVDNASKYTPEGGRILLRLRQDDKGDACIDVQDEGVGIGNKDVPHVFDRFYRSDAARNSQTGGSGLGLSIAKWIVDQHGGFFEIVSAEGFGTRVSIHLPQDGLRAKTEQA